MIGVSHTKKLKHATSFYKNSFGYHPPYLIICDSNFIFAALDNKINLEQQFTEIFKGKVYLKVTSCTYNEINKLKGKEFEEMKKFAKEGCQRFKFGRMRFAGGHHQKSIGLQPLLQPGKQ